MTYKYDFEPKNQLHEGYDFEIIPFELKDADDLTRHFITIVCKQTGTNLFKQAKVIFTQTTYYNTDSGNSTNEILILSQKNSNSFDLDMYIHCRWNGVHAASFMKNKGKFVVIPWWIPMTFIGELTKGELEQVFRAAYPILTDKQHHC